MARGRDRGGGKLPEGGSAAAGSGPLSDRGVRYPPHLHLVRPSTKRGVNVMTHHDPTSRRRSPPAHGRVYPPRRPRAAIRAASRGGSRSWARSPLARRSRRRDARPPPPRRRRASACAARRAAGPEAGGRGRPRPCRAARAAAAATPPRGRPVGRSRARSGSSAATRTAGAGRRGRAQSRAATLGARRWRNGRGAPPSPRERSLAPPRCPSRHATAWAAWPMARRCQ
mmetsp:Transcript_943/g.2963  ORF Transcript_943/g.2963 Transcript_943/m.2963 type:complete len:227 (+) Transcript_943:94-774(+)